METITSHKTLLLGKSWHPQGLYTGVLSSPFEAMTYSGGHMRESNPRLLGASQGYSRYTNGPKLLRRRLVDILTAIGVTGSVPDNRRTRNQLFLLSNLLLKLLKLGSRGRIRTDVYAAYEAGLGPTPVTLLYEYILI